MRPIPDHLARLLPSADHAAVLRLAFAPEFEPGRFLEWAGSIDIDQADHGVMRLLPVLHERLRQAGVEHPLAARIAGIYRHTVYRNRILMHRGLRLCARLGEAGISTLLMKGAALLAFDETRSGTRPMIDFDMLVPEDADPDAALAVLRSLEDLQIRETGRSAKGIVVVDKDGLEYDLHRHLQLHSIAAGSTRAYWDHAVSRSWHGTPVRAMCPEHHVFHSIWHGMEYEPARKVRWAADVLAVLSAADGFDWSLVTDAADENGCNLPLAVALTWLIDEGFDRPGMAAARDLLASRRDPWAERMLTRLRARPLAGAMRMSAWFVLQYLCLARRRGVRPGLRGFADHAREYWGAESLAALPRLAASRLVRNFRGAAPRDPAG